MLVLEWKERAFIKKVNSRCFCWFPTAILVHQNGTPIWRLLYKGAWNVSANNSETVGRKGLRLGQTVHILVFYSGIPPYDHPVYKTTSLLRPYSFKPNVKNIESFYNFEDPVNATTSLLWPGFYGPTVVVLTGSHCITIHFLGFFH